MEHMTPSELLVLQHMEKLRGEIEFLTPIYVNAVYRARARFRYKHRLGNMGRRYGPLPNLTKERKGST